MAKLLDNEEAEIKNNVVNQYGDGNTFVANANEVHISGPANVVLAGDKIQNVEMVTFGNIEICYADSKRIMIKSFWNVLKRILPHLGLVLTWLMKLQFPTRTSGN